MGHLLMSAKERERLKVLERVKRMELTLADAARVLGVSYRQAKRQYTRYRDEGDDGLVHRGRGQTGNRRLAFKEKVLERYRERYPDFGPTLAAEKLVEEGYELSDETLRLWLVEAGLWKVRPRPKSRHRSWRERRAHFGELLQLDGSDHKWFEDRAPRCCLMNLVDDATGKTLSLLSEHETTEAAMLLLWSWIEKYGIPAAIYADRKNVYIADAKLREQARDRGEEHYTQFGHACAKLGIKIIAAHSPQAKGRIERSNGVYQDRFVKELRLLEVSDIKRGNQVLAGGFVAKLNERFAVEPRKRADYHRSRKGYDLASIFCWEEERQLTSDWIVRFRNHYYQLQRQSQKPPTTKKVQVCELLNGELRFIYRNHSLPYTQLPKRPEPIAEKKTRSTKKTPKGKWTPPDYHPWRGLFSSFSS